MPAAPKAPSYRLHKPTGQAVVTLAGKDRYLGRHGTPESVAEYGRLVGEWMLNGRRAAATASDLTINELLVVYLDFADGYYRKNGEPTPEPAGLRLSFRPLRQHYGHTEVGEFGPSRLKAVRQAMIDARLCRPEINRRIGKIIRAIKWGVEAEMVSPTVLHGLKAVPGLKRGRTEAREPAPIRPVPDALVDAIRPHVSRQVWAMVDLQRLTGMRPGEVCIMRSSDLDTSGHIWLYTPQTHKTEHHGRERPIFLGPQAQAVLRPWLREEGTAYLFSPAEARVERFISMRENRKTPVQPSQRDRRKPKPDRLPADRYDPRSYHHAVRYGCAKANVPNWHPHQLRHNAATRLRKEFGLDTARAVLGHSSTAVTEIYAELDRDKAAEAMALVG